MQSQTVAGESIEPVCFERKFLELSFYRWYKQFWKIKLDEFRWLKELESEWLGLDKNYVAFPSCIASTG